ncbi:hypothetical protein HNO89_003918 [Sporosarcina luteola]|nr:hypothetical protein [Sporosarcina luteola]
MPQKHEKSFLKTIHLVYALSLRRYSYIKREKEDAGNQLRDVIITSAISMHITKYFDKKPPFSSKMRSHFNY